MSKGFVTWTDIAQHVPFRIGEQVHVNHDTCPAGVDTKRRLYIKNDHNAVLAYCHHCNGHYVKAKGKRRHKEVLEDLVEGDAAPDKAKPQLPDDCVSFNWDWPNPALGWVVGTGLAPEYLNDAGVVYSPSWGRVIIPVYNDGELVFWQGRNVGITPGPKYVSVSGEKKPIAVFLNKRSMATTLVITEDVMSALRVVQDTECDAMALLGTSISDEHITHIQNSDYRRVVVWLDMDAPGIEASTKIQTRLYNVLPCSVEAIRSYDEPKRLSNSALTNALFGY